MFETIDENKPRESLRELLVKIGISIACLAALGGIIYFFAFSGVAR